MRHLRPIIRNLKIKLFWLGFLTGLASGIVLLGGSVQYSICTAQIPAETPSVILITPNGGEFWKDTQTILWTATDPQGVALIYTIYYSSNGGYDWIFIITGLINSTYAWNSNSVTDGANYLIRIEATDGQYIGVDVSDAPFEIANGPFPYEWFITLPVNMALALVITVVSVVVLLGATLKATSISPPPGKTSWLDFLKRILWYLCYPFIWVFGHIVYPPVIRRLKKGDVTTNATRQAILHLLQDRGVAHLRELERAVKPGIFRMMWHLQVLEDFGHIRHQRISKYMVYYLKEFERLDPDAVELGLLLKNENARAIIRHIQSHPDTYQSEISYDLKLPHTTIRYHLLQMKELELLGSVSDGRRTRYFIRDKKSRLVDILLKQVKPESN